MQELPVRRFSARNLPALLAASTRRVPTRRFLREVLPEQSGDATLNHTFAEFEDAVAAVAEALSRSGITAFSRVMFLAENSSDYQILQLAIQTLRAEPCPVFSSVSAHSARDIASRVRPVAVYVSSQEQWEKLASEVDPLVTAGLRLRISPHGLPKPEPALIDLSMNELRKTPYVREVFDARVQAIQEDDPCLLLFTSGTTGKQKGVIVRQDAFVRALEGGCSGTGMSEADDGLMFLPFAHVAGQCQFMLAVALGHTLILVSRREDLGAAFRLGPTYSFAVPMVYEKLKQRVENNVANLKLPLRALLSAALRAAQATDEKERATLQARILRTLARNTIGKQLRKTLGGNLRMVACGGAAASAALAEFFETMGLPFLSIYGMSETAGLIFSQRVDRPRHAHGIGEKSPDLEVHISPEGELCVKGPMLMRGYLDAEDNASAYDPQGFFRTGDLIGYDPEIAEYRLVGRSKCLIVLSTGKKLSPEPIEAIINDLPYVQAAVLAGEGRPFPSVVLFILPSDMQALTLGSKNELAAMGELLHAALKEKLHGISEYEQPKRILIVPFAPSDRQEFVTPTMKLKRDVVISAMNDAIARLYENDSPPVQVCSS